MFPIANNTLLDSLSAIGNTAAQLAYAEKMSKHYVDAGMPACASYWDMIAKEYRDRARVN